VCYTVHYKPVAAIPFSPIPFSIQVSQRGCGFLAANVVNSICKGTSPHFKADR
jgi:hypothetical protein